MGTIKRKVLNIWDGGIQTSNRDNNPDTSFGAQMIKGFDIYKDKKKLLPMQSWEPFTTTEEKAFNIVAMGGISSTVYGLGSALKNWYGSAWSHRIKVNVNKVLCKAMSTPMYLNMASLPADFWTHVQADMDDVRATDKNGQPFSVFTENVDVNAHTGDMWLGSGIVESSTPALTALISKNAAFGGTSQIYNTSSGYATDFPVAFNGETINHLAFKVGKVGSPGDLTVKIYTDNAGVPGTLVSTLGVISAPLIGGDTLGAQDAILNFTAFTLTGNYHLVFTSNSVATDDSNYWNVYYNNSGTELIQYANNVGLSSWSTVDASAIPYYVFSYYNEAAIPEKYFYIYYGNPTVTALNYGSPALPFSQGGRNIFTTASLRFAYTFGDSQYDNKYYSDTVGVADETFTTPPHNISNGLVGKRIQTYGSMFTDDDHNVVLTGNDISFSFTLYTSTYENITLIQDFGGTWSVALNSLGKILFNVDGVSGSATYTSTLSIPLNQEVIIDVVYDNDYYIYIHGIGQLFVDNNGNYQSSSPNNGINVNTGLYTRIGQIWGYNNDLSADMIFTKRHNWTNANFFTVGAEEDITDFNKEYTGTQLYYKVIGSEDGWKELLEGGRPVKSYSVYPVNAFVDDTGTYFIVQQNNAEGSAGGFRYIAKRDFQNVADFTNVLLSVWSVGSKTLTQPESAINGTQYFNGLNAAVSKSDTASVFTVPGSIESMAAWRTYLAVGYTYRNNGYIQIWNLVVGVLANEKVNVGGGTLRILGNAEDILFSVSDNFADDAVRSANHPTMEIRRYVGNGSAKTTHVIKIPKVITEYSNFWERAISNFKLKRNTQTLFYARLPKDETGETFNEGFWSVGVNSNDELSLALQIDTEGLEMPKNVFAFAQQVFFIAKDGGIHRLSEDTYNNIALYTTMKMNEGVTGQDKKLHGVEIVTEPLDEGQTISVYYKSNNDAVRRKVFTMTGEGEVFCEATFDDEGLNLCHYKEIEFDIESTGGKAAPLELFYRYEYLADII